MAIDAMFPGNVWT